MPWPAPLPRDADGRAWPTNVGVVTSPRYPLVMGTPFAAPRLLACESVLGAVDVFHGTAYALPRTRRAATVLTVHDLTLLRFPELGTPALRRSVQLAAARAGEARLVIADSQATRRDLIALAGVRAQAIRAVPLGVDAAFRPMPAAAARTQVAARLGIGEPYLLHVGTLEPRKNLPLLIDAAPPLARRACRASAGARQSAGLGRDGGGGRDRPPRGRAPGDPPRTRRRRRPAGPLRRCRCRAGPVAQRGLRPAAARGAGLRRAGDRRRRRRPARGRRRRRVARRPDRRRGLVGRDRPRFADAGLAARLLRAAGPPRAAQFTWQRCARETLAVYEEAVSSSRPRDEDYPTA
ncbi:MAG: glycosyltransferase [Candidatus Binatia bacterium]